jgi:hypothetical protein
MCPALIAILDSEEFRGGQVHTGLAMEIVAREKTGVRPHLSHFR